MPTRPNGLKGAEILFPQISVGATENLLMAASLAKGETRLINAAREPEVTDLAHCLIKMGAKIDGLGQRHAHGPGGRPPARRAPQSDPRPHRGRHLHHGRDDH